jgi:hypothetical protein
MKSLEISFRPLMISAVLLLLVVGLAPQSLLAQTVSASPVALSFGVPTGTAIVSPCTVPCSATESLTVNIVGATPSTPVVFGSTTKTGPNAGDFSIAGDSCSGQTFTSAATCQVAVYFNASYYNSTTPPPTTLETATLTLSVTSEGVTAPPPVPLSGAYGAIKLWDEINVTASANGVTPSNFKTIANWGQNLSCPAGIPITATLSNTPDGNGYIVVDNYITLSVNGTPVNNGQSGNNPPGNVCFGGPADSNGGVSFNDCFSSSYQGPAAAGTLNGQDPDTFANPGNPVLSGAAGGLPPINLTAFFGPGTVQATFTALDQGYVYDSSTVFLATNCSPGGLIPGSTATGNPTPTNTISFDSNPGTDLSITDNTAQNPPSVSGTVPTYTQIAVPQQLFYQLVAGTSAAPDVCLRASSELDYSPTLLDPPAAPAPMCVGILIQCYNPADGTTSGNNCDSSTPVGLRDLYDTVQFASPDAPVNGFNFLYSPVGPAETAPADACSYYLANPNRSGSGVTGGACATGTGPGVVMGGDTWLCAPGSTIPPNAPGGCTPLEPNTSYPAPLPEFNTLTSPGTTVYSRATDALTGGLVGDLSPLDGLTQFLGAADGSGGSSVPLKNSVFFLVANHPLPTASAAIGQYGWVNSSTANVNFTANAAAYPPSGANPIPSANGFAAAPLYSVTYGVTPASSPLPDTTYPVPGDVTVLTPESAPSFGNPLCSAGAPSSFSPTANILPLTSSQPDGLYNLHYYATDCALTEGLVFNPTNLSSPTTNWASFPVQPFGIDTVAPTFSAVTCSPAPGTGTWYGGPSGNITVTCMNAATDQNWVQGQTGSGFLPLVGGIQGSQTENVSLSTGVTSGTISTTAYATPASPVCDLAGNCVSGGVSVGPYQIDLQAPTITASAGSTTVGGTAITVTYTCSDAGSGIPANTGCVITNTPANYVAGGCSPSSGASVACSGTIPATIAESGALTVNATDVVGNVSSTVVNYTVSAATPIITFGATTPPSPTYLGGNFTVSASTTNTDSATLTYSVVSGPCAFVSGATFSSTGAGTCVVKASGAATTNFNAASNTQNVTINKATPIVTFGAAPMPIAGSNFVVSASTTNTDSATLTYSYVSGPCAFVSGATFSTSGAGTCVVMASGAATTNFNAASNTQNVNISAPAVWTITPSSWYFGRFYPGQGASKTFTIHNPGTTSVAISVSIPGSNSDSNPQPAGDPDDFRITSSGCGKTLAGGASCNVTVYFSADSDDSSLPNGSYAYLTVTSSGTILVQAQMTAKVINPRVSLSTNSLSFGTIATGTTSAAKKVTLTNSGTGITPLTFGTISISPNYALAPGTTCVNGGNVAAGASCYIYVTFSPVSGSSDPGSVTITDNAPSGTQTISLSGR